MHKNFVKHLVLASIVSLLPTAAMEETNSQTPVESAQSQSMAIKKVINNYITNGALDLEKNDINSYTAEIKSSLKKLVTSNITQKDVYQAFEAVATEISHTNPKLSQEINTWLNRNKPSLPTNGSNPKPLPFALPIPEPVPLTQMSPDRMEWSMTVANAVNPYFSQPYKDATDTTSEFYALKCPDSTVVNRPNHSLAHGLRQAYLAVDIVVFLNSLKTEDISHLGEEGKKLQEWIKRKLKDKSFLKKIEFANAFQRSGRQSEITRSNNKKKYEEYLAADQNNFLKNVQKHIGQDKLFQNEAEVAPYKEAIVKKFDKREPGIDDDTYFLSKIFYAAHQLDLRRLPHFSKPQIQTEISLQLFETDTPSQVEGQLISKLWNRSGDYLNATGDRDMDDKQKSSWNVKVFCDQAHNPELLVLALQTARVQPETKLFQSIVSHTQAMRKLKEGDKPDLEENASKAIEFRKILEEAPYTASEAYLKLLLGEKYREIPPTAPEDEARYSITQNVKNFLAEPKRVKDSNAKIQTFLPRIENPDDEYMKILVDCMMEERKNRGKVVLYHATEPETGFLYDVYTQLRNQLVMEGGNDIRALRAIDKEFSILDREAQKDQGQGEKQKANVGDFMRKFKGTADDNSKYQDMVLSINFSLFGSDQQTKADTYNMFYIVKSEPISTSPVNGPKFFAHIESQTGIPIKYDEYKPIMTKYIKGCERLCSEGYNYPID